MIKKGKKLFYVSASKYFKKVVGNALINPSTTTSSINCCEVCANTGILCHAVCKYRSATYKEYLEEKFSVGEALVKGLEIGIKEGKENAKNFKYFKNGENGFDCMPGNKKQ